MKYLEAAIGGIAGAVIAAATTYWITVDQKLTDARYSERNAELLNEYFKNNDLSVRKISKAENQAETAVKRVESLVSEFVRLKEESEKLSKSIQDSKVLFDEAVAENLGVSNEKVADIVEERVKAEFSLNKAVIAFYLKTCPSGWEELIDARGRYIVGSYPGSEVGNTVGIKLESEENRNVGLHSHEYTDTWVGSSGKGIASGKSYPRPTTDKKTEPAGEIEGTNSPYIQLVICRKT